MEFEDEENPAYVDEDEEEEFLDAFDEYDLSFDDDWWDVYSPEEDEDAEDEE